MYDDQLREHFTRWAQPLREVSPPALAVLRRRARRRTFRTAAFSGLAVAAAAAIALSGFQWAGRAPAGAPAASAAARGVPRYAVLLGRAGAPASMLDMVTGKSLGRIVPPAAGSDFGWVAAAADDRTFVLTDERDLVVRFYLLRLTASGKPGRLVQLKVPALHASQVYGMALTADASRLAVAWQNDPIGPVVGHLSVTALSTGATRTWSSALGAAITVSWAGDRMVAFYWSEPNGAPANSGLRLLDTAGPGASLPAARMILPDTTGTPEYYSPGAPVITQDGSTVLAVRSTSTRSAFVSYSARTGKLRAVLTPPMPYAGSQSYCGILWTSPDGRHLVVQCGDVQASIEGSRYTPTRLHQLIPASPIGYANTFAW
jgi:hypothetical protein